ncbi:MAG: hypothetical protein JJT78_05910 [Leptospira sp.]|nr:hypothetical protein [Leptospira sp.]
MNKPLTAIIWGSTGLIGSELKSLLVNDPRYSKILCPVRNISPVEKSESAKSPTGSSKIEEIQINFEDLEKNLQNQDSKSLNPFQADHVFVTLGTTIKKAGSQEAFRRVDYDYCLLAGQVAEATGAKVFSLVTAIGSSAKSPIFYNRVKGELEEAVSKLNIPKIRVFQPSLLLGNRKEFRLGEKVGEVVSAPLSFLLMGGLKKYRPIQGREVAEKMVEVAIEESGVGNDSQFLRMDFS